MRKFVLATAVALSTWTQANATPTPVDMVVVHNKSANDPIHLVIVQDISQSFAPNMANVRVALAAVLDAAESWPRGSTIGMSTFVGGTEPRPWTPLTATSHLDSVRAQWGELGTCNCANDQIVVGDMSWCEAFNMKLNGDLNMQDCFLWGSQTNPAEGLEQATKMLGGVQGRKVIALISDGLTCCRSEGKLEAQSIELTHQIGKRGWDVWVVGSHKPDFLAALRQNRGQVVLYPIGPEGRVRQDALSGLIESLK